ncbi:hypothetical protein BRARA_I00074 [Brassica rapa]|uniref:Uncharacterized protein n=1 Tax=Brassica campestris TaxID=3711 RepID=A0A397XPU3_BRACM|nr:hypothetical protein BRARA_I00074 [Brassica rapa]
MQNYFLNLQMQCQERSTLGIYLQKTTIRYNKSTSNLSLLNLWSFGNLMYSCVSLMHSSTLSGEIKPSATFMHDCKQFQI